MRLLLLLLLLWLLYRNEEIPRPWLCRKVLRLWMFGLPSRQRQKGHIRLLLLLL